MDANKTNTENKMNKAVNKSLVSFPPNMIVPNIAVDKHNVATIKAIAAGRLGVNSSESQAMMEEYSTIAQIK